MPDGIHIRSERFGEQKHFFHMPVIEPQSSPGCNYYIYRLIFFDFPAKGLVAVPNEPTRVTKPRIATLNTMLFIFIVREKPKKPHGLIFWHRNYFF